MRPHVMDMVLKCRELVDKGEVDSALVVSLDISQEILNEMDGLRERIQGLETQNNAAA